MLSSLTKNFPDTHGVRWFNVGVLTVTPAIAVYGLLFAQQRRETMFFSVVYYIFSMLGYHRLWSHRSYNASSLLQYFLLFGGTSAVQGSCYWWARAHRSHHRHTDTDLDPYDANRGLLWTHIGWMVFKSKLRSGAADVSDLRKDPLIQWQHHHYFPLAMIFGYLLPSLVPGIFWGDWLGGICFSGALRLTSTFCINSIAHWLGSTPYDDVLSPRDHLLSAILTMGEGYHNFHHQFPMDYRNAFHWYQYDPPNATHLRLKNAQENISWPKSLNDLPIISWNEFQEESRTRPLILVSGFIHDVTDFIEQHPGGESYLTKSSGADATAQFFGGLLSMMRVAVLAGGVETVGDNVIPPSQRLFVSERSP
ncbi:hypothetical protein BDQ17DRAFT_1379305 [Cyathus striatus]|nr:hypothetical protein BDQ17DRAFT_1379305 [Cyathus striatus]